MKNEKKLEKINIVIPMAWAGNRFKQAWYTIPKPLINVHWKAMYEWAISSFDFLEGKYKLKFFFIVLKEHVIQYSIDKEIKSKYKNSKIIVIDSITRWQAETVLKAKDSIDDSRMIIYNSDTFSVYDYNDFPIWNSEIDWIITCFESNNLNYSYVKLDDKGNSCEVAEKKVISNYATNGLYYFRRWFDFFQWVELMLKEENFTNGEAYVWPVYNYLINDGKIIKIAPIKTNRIMWTPEELDYFLLNYKN